MSQTSPETATPEMVKAAYAAYENDAILTRADDWLEAVINAALAARSGLAQTPAAPVAWRWRSIFNTDSWTLGDTEPTPHEQYVIEPLYNAHAQCQQEPRWTEDGLALAFFDYSACSERRCGWTEPGDCDCRNAARKAVHWIKHVLPRSFPLASSDTSTDCEGK